MPTLVDDPSRWFPTVNVLLMEEIVLMWKPLYNHPFPYSINRVSTSKSTIRKQCSNDRLVMVEITDAKNDEGFKRKLGTEL